MFIHLDTPNVSVHIVILDNGVLNPINPGSRCVLGKTAETVWTTASINQGRLDAIASKKTVNPNDGWLPHLILLPCTTRESATG